MQRTEPPTSFAAQLNGYDAGGALPTIVRPGESANDADVENVIAEVDGRCATWPEPSLRAYPPHEQQA
jgi:hypothetical protein